MATQLITIPFAQGQDEETDKRQLNPGPFREAVNVRQRRGKAFGVRADYPAVSMTETFGGPAMVPYDLYSLNGRLLAMGDRQSQSRPTDIFELVGSAAGNWHGTLNTVAGGVGERIPVATAVRNVGQPPDGAQDIAVSRVAAVNGLVCHVYSDSLVTGGSVTFAHIFNPTIDSTLVFTKFNLSMARVVQAGNSFWLIGVNAALDLEGYRFDTTTSGSFGGAVTLYTGTVTSCVYDAVSVFAVSIAQFAFVVRDGATTVVRRFNEAGVQQLSFAGPAVAADVIAIEADSAANQIVIANRVGNADCNVQTFNLTTGASVVGPTAVFGEPVTNGLSLVRQIIGGTLAELCTDDAGGIGIVRRAVFNTTAHARTITTTEGYTLGGRGVAAFGIGVLQPVHFNVDNQLLLLQSVNNSVMPTLTLDRGVAATGSENLSSFEDVGGGTCKDVSTGKYYYSRLIRGTDGQIIPTVCEFVVGSTARRQACEIGNSMFFTGGLPLMYDGRQVVEAGFTERPLFNGALTGSAAGGMTAGASYDYVYIWKWTSSQNREAKSLVSAIKTITLTTTQHSVIASVYPPHTLRRDASTGNSPTLSLYRTFAAVTTITASIQSSRDFASVPAAAGDFTGLTLILSVDGGANQTVTFAAGDNTITEMVTAINVQTAGLTASTSGAFITIVSDVAGIAGSISVTGGTTTAAGIGFIGFFTGQTSTGVSTFTKGTVFQLATSLVVPLSGNFGAPVTVTDTTSDAVLLTKEPLYTQGERGALTGILEHSAPPPCRYCWTVGDRVFIGGLPDPSQVQISKALFPSESISFSDNFAFVSTVDGDVTAVASLDGTPIAFTSESIYAFSNQFPDDNGDNGELGAPHKLPSEGGCINSASVVETSMGLFYQARDTKLMLIPRGGATPIWAGAAVQDTLALFPNITGAVYVDVDHCVVFTCRAINLASSVNLVLDLRLSGMTKNGFALQWYKDTYAVAQNISACVQHSGVLAYIDGAVVRQQATSLTPATFIPYNAKTGSILPFGGNAYGKMPSITVSGEKRGDALIRCLISYDDGVTFTSLKQFAITTAAGYVTGESFTCSWFPARRKGDSFVLDFQVTTAGTATEGLKLNDYTLEVEASKPQRVRLGTAERG